MGLLDALKQYVSDSMPGGLLNPEWNKTNGQRLAEELNRGLLESTGINARDKRRVWNKEKLDAVTGSSDTKASLNQQAYDSAMAMAGMAPMGLTVWHGSPHKFSKFDMSKIGTGEGAQAYGHGLYMAESPEVAGSYAGMLAPNPRLAKNGEYLDAQKYSEMLAESRAAGAGSLDKAIQRTKGALQDLPQNGRGMGILEETGSSVDDAGRGFDVKQEREILASLLKLRRKGYEVKQGGELYKVDIPDEAVARFLDWDKPLSQQAPEVQKAIYKIKPKASASEINVAHAKYQSAMDSYMSRPASMNPDSEKALESAVSSSYDEWQTAKGLNDSSGALAYWGLGKGKTVPEISELLRQAGIPGIRYLDGGSRAGGQGTSNYVLFSDQLPRILEVNGKPTGQTPWAAGEWQGLLSQ